MRLILTTCLAALASCSGSPSPPDSGPEARFVDTDGDGLPDRRSAPDGDGFVDTDGDGLPDARVGGRGR